MTRIWFDLCTIGSAAPVGFDAFGEEGEGDVVGAAAGASQFTDHAHCTVCIPRVHEDGRGALEFRVGAEPAGDGVAGAFVVS